MVTKSENNKANEQTKPRAKVGKLQLNKERIKDLTPDQQKQLKGGQIVRVGPTVGETRGFTCSCVGCS